MRVAGVPGTIAKAGELLDFNPQDLCEPHQDAVTIDAAPAALHLGQPGLGPADEPGKHSL